MRRYEVLTAGYPEGLTVAVNNAVQRGARPLGGVTVAMQRGGYEAGEWQDGIEVWAQVVEWPADVEVRP